MNTAKNHILKIEVLEYIYIKNGLQIQGLSLTEWYAIQVPEALGDKAFKHHDLHWLVLVFFVIVHRRNFLVWHLKSTQSHNRLLRVMVPNSLSMRTHVAHVSSRSGSMLAFAARHLFTPRV